ncbi:hypothetical protein [Zavarzinella formosa]|uniref:hypothetical protein n=1 Tax=Zavarzinella formosa TaxID=360055 RepID=UPI000300728E|nr:hypothetical protein [Zavarzinella formosa]
MFNSVMLETGIGLIFVFLLLSLVCTAAKEVLESWLRMRARSLELGLQEMLTDYANDKWKQSKGIAAAPNTEGAPALPAQQNLVEKLYNHPLICCLFRGKYDPANLKQLPAYIPAKSFALALLDVIKPAKQALGQPAERSGASGATPPASPPVAVTPPVVMPLIMTQAADGQPATISAVPVVPAPPAAATPDPLKDFRDTVGTIENEQVKKALLAMIDAANGDINQLRQNLEAWFNSSMDRVSGWYKRHTQYWLLGIAAVVTVALNVDTIAIARALQNDKLRQEVVAAAEKKIQEAPPSKNGDSKTPSDAWQDLKQTNAALSATGLPMGWDFDDFRSFPTCDNLPAGYPKKSTGYVISAWVMKIFGLLMTILAVSLGAPFWFDILNRFMILRSTVKPQEKSQDESSKDPVNKK